MVLPLLVAILSVGESLHAEELLSLHLSWVALRVPVAHLAGVVVRVLRPRQRLQRQAFGHIGERLKHTEGEPLTQGTRPHVSHYDQLALRAACNLPECQHATYEAPGESQLARRPTQ